MFIKTNPTNDEQAKAINAAIDDVARAVEVGGHLRKIFWQRFHGNVRQFRKWVTQNLDLSVQTSTRYMTCHLRRDRLVAKGICRLNDAYALLNLKHDTYLSDDIWEAGI